MVFSKFVKRMNDALDDLKKRSDERYTNVKDALSTFREDLFETLEPFGLDFRSKQEVYFKDVNKVLNMLGIEPPYPTFETFEVDGDLKLLVILDLPGFTKEDIELECSPKRIRISGKAKITNDENREVKKAINLPEVVNPQTAKANLENGILKLELKIVR